jgi:hypothetical protein
VCSIIKSPFFGGLHRASVRLAPAFYKASRIGHAFRQPAMREPGWVVSTSRAVLLYGTASANTS